MEVEPIGRGIPVAGLDAITRTAEAAGPALISAVRSANRAELFGHDRELAFARDNETRKLIIQIKDRQSGEVLQQIPPQTLLERLRNSAAARNVRSKA